MCQNFELLKYIFIFFNHTILLNLKLYNSFLGEWGSSHMILRGHRSIVNQVRYNVNNNFIASSGVEKMVKVKFLLLFLNSYAIIIYFSTALECSTRWKLERFDS